jgi:peptide/nickel transport system substrate-binding protein
MKRFVCGRPLALALVLCGALAALTATALGANRASSVVSMRLSVDTPTLDAYQDAGRGSPWAVMSPAYDRLVARSPNGPKIRPYLAKSWVQKAKSVTFTLRKDATCTDGHKLTAVDVLNSVKLFLNVPKRSGTVSVNNAGTWGPGPFHLHASNKRGTFFFGTEKPWRNILGAFSNFPIVCPNGIAAVRANPRAMETAMFGSGPYTLESYKPGDQIVFKLRPQWHWGPPGTSTKTMPDTLIYKVLTNNTTAANLLATGDLTYGLVEGQDVDRLLTMPLTHQVVQNQLVSALGMNQAAGRVFSGADGAKLREAVFTAIDRQKFNQAWLDGKGINATSTIRHDAECFDPKTKSMVPASGNVDRAKQILANAGFSTSGGKLTKNGQRVPQITLLMSTVMNAAPEYVNSVLNELGFDVNFRNLDATTYGTSVVQGNFDVTVFRGARLNPEAGEQLGIYTGLGPSKGGTNYASIGIEDPEYSRLAIAASQNPGAGGCRYFALVQERQLRNFWLLPLVEVNQDYFGQKGIFFPWGAVDASAYGTYYIKVPN